MAAATYRLTLKWTSDGNMNAWNEADIMLQNAGEMVSSTGVSPKFVSMERSEPYFVTVKRPEQPS